MSFFKRFFKRPSKRLPSRNIDDLKRTVNILFIDDEKFSLIDRLKDKDGWKNIIRIKDVDSLSQTEVRNAHILCIDIQGVGKKMNFPDAGLGLIVALKKEYPNKKIIMYSAESQGRIDAFHNAANLVDKRLRKTATQYQFSNAIETLSREAFCLENCINRIKTILFDEFGLVIEEGEIEKRINRLYQKNQLSNAESLAKAFNIQNAGAIADVIQLFLSLSAL